MKQFKLLDITLKLFDGAASSGTAGAATAGGEAGASTQGTASDGAQQPKAGTQAKSGSGHRANKAGGLNSVIYGKQPTADTAATEAAKSTTDGQKVPDAGGEARPATPEEKKARFKELVNGEYKDVYTEEFQTAFDRRFKGVKEQQEAYAKLQPIVDMLSTKYKIENGNIDKLQAAIEQDDETFAAAAAEANMEVDQFRKFQKLQLENQAFKQQQARMQADMQQQAQLRKWVEEGEAVKATYPDFDLSRESKEPRFLSMLRSGVPVQHAYEVLHLADIKQGVAAQTAQQTEKKVVDNIRSKGSRPPENGTSSASGLIVKSDVSRLTKADRAEIAKRAMRGENISF